MWVDVILAALSKQCTLIKIVTVTVLRHSDLISISIQENISDSDLLCHHNLPPLLRLTIQLFPRQMVQGRGPWILLADPTSSHTTGTGQHTLNDFFLPLWLSHQHMTHKMSAERGLEKEHLRTYEDQMMTLPLIPSNQLQPILFPCNKPLPLLIFFYFSIFFYFILFYFILFMLFYST